MIDMPHDLNRAQYEELKALASFNEIMGRPVAIHRLHLSGTEPNYQSLADAGLVKIYARAPKGWGSKRFFGARITKAGRDFLALPENNVATALFQHFPTPLTD